MPDLVAHLITLTCPTCGAKLNLVDNINLLVCASCGNEHIVHRGGGAIYLAPIAQDVRQIRVGVDKTAAELAVVRLTKELAAINDEISATRTLNYTNNVKPAPLLGYIPVSMLACFALVGVASRTGNAWLAISMVFALIALIIWYAILNGSRAREGHILKQLEIDRLQAQYDAKTAALVKNHQIANS